MNIILWHKDYLSSFSCQKHTHPWILYFITSVFWLLFPALHRGPLLYICILVCVSQYIWTPSSSLYNCWARTMCSGIFKQLVLIALLQFCWWEHFLTSWSQVQSRWLLRPLPVLTGLSSEILVCSAWWFPEADFYFGLLKQALFSRESERECVKMKRKTQLKNITHFL